MKRKHGERMAGLLVIAAALCWALLVVQWHRSIRPNDPTLARLLAKIPQPAKTMVFATNGREYLVVVGQLPPIYTFPSGAPAYVFDQSGYLVDWTADSGDAEAFHQCWPGVLYGRAIDQMELAKWPNGL